MRLISSLQLPRLACPGDMIIRHNVALRRTTVLALLIASGCAVPSHQPAPALDVARGVPRSHLTEDPLNCAEDPLAAALQQHAGETDSTNRWEVVQRERGENGVVLRLELVSQEWHGVTWKHSLLLFLPSGRGDADLVLLVLRQGDPTEGDLSALRTISEATGTAAAFLFNLPNQPLFNGLEEDPLLAYTYSQYLRTGDDSWPLLVPMVRSVVRAMDAIEEVSAGADGVPSIKRYVVAGHSKRGHAAWLAGAADSRVAGILPIAIDVLNSREQIAHHRAVAGEISFSSQIFSEVIRAADSPRGRCLIEMIDPFTYRTRLDEPKLVVLGTNDDYTPTDALNLYWDHLPGPRSLLYLANTSHAGANAHPSVNAAAFAFVRAVAAGALLPEIELNLEIREQAVVVRATPGAPTSSARLWTAPASGRDFRRSAWTVVGMRQGGTKSGAAVFQAEAPLPLDGYAAFFVEVEFESADGPFRLSTQIHVIEGGTGHIISPP